MGGKAALVAGDRATSSEKFFNVAGERIKNLTLRKKNFKMNKNTPRSRHRSRPGSFGKEKRGLFGFVQAECGWGDTPV